MSELPIHGDLSPSAALAGACAVCNTDSGNGASV